MSMQLVGGTPLRVWWLRTVTAWWYGRHLQQRRKPLLRATFAEGDQIAEARFLAEAGYFVAAACLCRTAIESQMKRASSLSPTWSDVRKTRQIQMHSRVLYLNDLWPKEQHNRFSKLYAALSRVAHNGQHLTLHCWTLRCWSLIAQSAELMQEMNELVIRCSEAMAQHVGVRGDSTSPKLIEGGTQCAS